MRTGLQTARPERQFPENESHRRQAEKSMQKRQRSGNLSVRQLPVYRTERQSTALNTAKEFNQNVDSRNKG